MANPLKPRSIKPFEPNWAQSTNEWADWVTSAINQLAGQGNVPPSQGLPSLIVNTVDPSTSALLSKGSRPQSIATSITYVATATGVTFYWDGTNGSTPLSIYRDDGTIVSPIVGNQAVTGLSASTTYYFYPYYNESSGQVAWASVSGVSIGSPGYAFTAKSVLANQQQILRGHIPLAIGLAITGVTTPASGSSSGSGGSGGGGGGSGSGGRLS